MPPRALAKLVLTLAGVIVFGIGVRTKRPEVRWGAVGLVAIAFVLRFAGRWKPDE